MIVVGIGRESVGRGMCGQIGRTFRRQSLHSFGDKKDEINLELLIIRIVY